MKFGYFEVVTYASIVDLEYHKGRHFWGNLNIHAFGCSWFFGKVPVLLPLYRQRQNIVVLSN
jgi:hypothetical protein